MKLQHIYIVGYPRSGNTWLGRLLSDVLGCGYTSIDEGPYDFCGDKTDAPYLIHKSHATESPDRLWTVLIVRDPRDVAVSVAHYLCAGNILTAIEAMTQPIELWGVASYLDFMRAWRYPHRALCEVHYEDLHTRSLVTLGALAAILSDHEPTNAALALAFQRQAIEVSRQKYPPTNGTRNGRTGEWREAFTAEIAQRFNQYFGQVLIDLDYETDDGWMRRYA